ncbi:MAG: ATP synthase F0 subunit C [Bdellovibrionaceae bacterium]|nr:ATP synthase F0 subunit C [Pseudobdellovibrionaceae bacterium]MDW8190273.1 ATP synthase F0 subunit C [Pseudobdellovibrionaceae bacterium]
MNKIVMLSMITLAAGQAFAETAAQAPSVEGYKGWLALGAGLAIGIAALGGSLAQGRAASSALDGIARNPAAEGKMFTPMVLSLALIESLVIMAFVIAIFLQGKI